MRPAVRLAGKLLLVSGVTHLAQWLVYEEARVLAGVTIFGLAYLAIGAGILAGSPRAVRLGAILPAIGGVGGTIRFLAVEANPFSAGHVAIDLVVAPICLREWTRERRERKERWNSANR